MSDVAVAGRNRNKITVWEDCHQGQETQLVNKQYYVVLIFVFCAKT
jgi:hypothetical protein